MKIINNNCGPVILPEVYSAVHNQLGLFSRQNINLTLDAERVFMGIYRHYSNYVKHYSPQSFENLLAEFLALKLPASDVEAIFNFTPCSFLELYLCIPDLDTKLNEEQIQELLNIILKTNLSVMQFKLNQHRKEFEEVKSEDSDEY